MVDKTENCTAVSSDENPYLLVNQCIQIFNSVPSIFFSSLISIRSFSCCTSSLRRLCNSKLRLCVFSLASPTTVFSESLCPTCDSLPGCCCYYYYYFSSSFPFFPATISLLFGPSPPLHPNHLVSFGPLNNNITIAPPINPTLALPDLIHPP